MGSLENIQDLFPGFIKGTLTPQELDRLFRHFGNTNEVELRGLIRAEMESDEEHIEPIPSQRMEEIYRKIDQRIAEEVRPQYTGRSIRLPVLMRYAASLLILIGLTWLVVNKFKSGQESIAWNKVTTGYERKKIVLSDGTGIWLGPQTSLVYPAKFQPKSRTVKLNGEAFFEVTKDPERPFKIQSGELTTTVLGTSFNIDAYAGEKSASVTVLTGKVSVASTTASSNEVKLLPFQRALLNADSRKIVMQEFPEANELLSLREGNIRYEGASLADIVRDLEKITPYQINVKGDLSGCVFYGEKKAGDSPVAFLENVCLVNNLTLKKQSENLLIITGRGCGK